MFVSLLQVELILKLKQLLNKFDATQKRAEGLQLQKQRLEFVTVSMQNVIKKKKRHGANRDMDSEVCGILSVVLCVAGLLQYKCCRFPRTNFVLL